MQVDIDRVVRRKRIGTEEATKGIKRCGRVRILQRPSQTRLADLTQGQVLSFVASVTEAKFPVPSLKIIAELTHLTLQSNIKDVIPVGKLLASKTSIVSATKPDASSYRDSDPVNNHGRICYRERIKWIGKWHTDAGRAKPYASSRNFKRIRRKRNSRQSRIEKRARNLEIGKYGQVFVAQVASERTVNHLAICRRQRRRESREVKGDKVPVRTSGMRSAYKGCGPTVQTKGAGSGIKRRGRSVRSRMRRRSVRAEKQTGNQPETLHPTGEIATANIESAEPMEITV